MFRNLLKLTAVCAFTVLLVTGVAYYVVAAPTQDASLFRVEVKSPHGENVSISVPPALLDTLYDVMPSEIKRICQELELTPAIILQELETLEGEDLIRIEGAEQVRVWMEPVTDANRKDLGFIRIRVVENEEEGKIVNINVPRGLVQLAGRIIKQLDLVDKFVEMPDEIKALSVNTSAN